MKDDLQTASREARPQADLAAFFDRLADSWDSLAVHPAERVSFVLGAIGLAAGSRVLDVGCGTGVLEPYLAAALGPAGRVLALDLSPRMIGLARERRSFPTVEYRVADFLALEGEGSFDFVLVYSAFPHFLDRPAFLEKAASVLSPGGRLAVAHIESRAAINSMHREGGAPSLELPQVGELADLAARFGFRTLLSRDDEYYLYLGEKAGSR